MIAWLQKVLQRHYKWLFIGLLGIIIISFVFTIGSSPGISTGKGIKAKKYYGYNLGDKQTIQQLFLAANISSLTNTGQTLSNDYLAQNQALVRPPLLFLAEKLQLPNPSETAFAQYLQKRPIFLNKEGQFDPKLYEQFITYVKSNPALQEGRVREVVTEDYKIDEVLKTLMSPGYFLPYEAVLVFQIQNTRWSLDVAVADLSPKESAIDANENDIETYYNEHSETFRQPERLKLSYVQFQKKNFTQALRNPSDAELEAFYQNNPSLFAKEDGKIPTFSEVGKEALLKKHKQAQAGQLALEAANNLIYELYEHNIAYGSQAFSELLSKNNIKLQHFEPLSAEAIAQEKEVTREILREAFKLDKTHYYSSPTPTNNDVYVIFYEDKLPSQVLPFEEIKEKVKKSYLVVQTQKAKLKQIRQLEDAILKGQAKGQSFSDIAKVNGLTIRSYNDLLLQKLPEDFPQAILGQLITLTQGKTTTFVTSDDKGFIAYVNKKTVPTVNVNSDEYKTLQKQLAAFNSTASADTFIQELVEKGLNRK